MSGLPICACSEGHGMKELAAHESRLIDWSWLRVAGRRFASSRSYWLLVPGWCFRITWARTNSRSWVEWFANEREYPYRRSLKLGRRRSLFLTLERTRVSREGSGQ